MSYKEADIHSSILDALKKRMRSRDTGKKEEEGREERINAHCGARDKPL